MRKQPVAAVHFSAIRRHAFTRLWPYALCTQANAREFSTYEPDVTCRKCLYQLGRYVPLSLLREHQLYQQRIAS